MDMNFAVLGAGLALGGAGLWVALGQGNLTRSAIDILGKNPNLSATLMIYTILGVALVESAAIYALVVAFKIIAVAATIDPMNAIAAGIVMGMTGFGAGYGQGMLVSHALESVNRNPENKAQVLQFMVLFVALVETVAIYGLIVAFKLLG